MIRKHTSIAATFIFFCMMASLLAIANGNEIKRLTYSVSLSRSELIDFPHTPYCERSYHHPLTI